MFVGSNNADSGKGVPFLAFVDIAAHLWDQITPKPQFQRCESAFFSQMCQILKHSYYQTYCIDRNQILHSDRDHAYSLSVVEICPKEIQGGGRLPFSKNAISPQWNNQF